MTPRHDHASTVALPAAAGPAGTEVIRGTGSELRFADAESSPQLRMDLRVGRDCLKLRLAGSFDPSAADRLQVLLASLERLERPVHVNAGQVDLIDVHDLVPLAETAQRGKDQWLAPLLLTEFCSAVAQLLANLHVPGSQFNDRLCWPLDGSGTASAIVRRKGHLRLRPSYGRADNEGAGGLLAGRGPRSAT
jgi:hypothetical protein